MVFDALIVGAGPAGCAAAIRGATHGLRVALVEQTVYPRHLPGEALHPDVEQVLSELGLAKAISRARFIRNPGWIRDHAGERDFMPFDGPAGLGFGYQAWRSVLDSILLARARSAGVRVIQPAITGEVILKDNRVAGLEVNGKPWYCDYLLDCSGSVRWLSRKLQMTVESFSPRLVARYGYLSGHYDLGVIPEFREHSCGWTWLARVRKDCCQCVQLSLTTDAGAPVPPPPFAGVGFRGADVTWRLVLECAGPGYFLCGDAAAVLDPAAASGVARAFTSGLKAADLMVQVATKRIEAIAAEKLYREWYAIQFVQQARQLAGRYAELENPPVWLGGLERHFAQLEEFVSNPVANAESAVIPSS